MVTCRQISTFPQCWSHFNGQFTIFYKIVQHVKRIQATNVEPFKLYTCTIQNIDEIETCRARLDQQRSQNLFIIYIKALCKFDSQ